MKTAKPSFMNRIILLLFFLLAPIAGAQNTDPQQLETLSQQQMQAEAQARELLERQKEIETEIARLRRDLVTASSEARTFEQATSTAKDRLDELSREEQDLRETILQDREALADLLAALQRIERRPPPALLVDGRNAVDAVRAAHLLAYLSQGLHDKSGLLKERLGNLQTIRTHMAQSREEIERNADQVEIRLAAIKSVISEKSTLHDQVDANRRQKTREAETLAKEAKDLRDLIQRFERRASAILPILKPEVPVLSTPTDPNPRLKPTPGRIAPVFTPPGTRRFSDARGLLPLPVYGRLAQRFGSTLGVGGKAQGITLTTKTGAQVVAPFSGQVEFSGVFNDDRVLILNVGDGYFIVFTGMGEIYADGGIGVVAGEPLGRMPIKGGASTKAGNNQTAQLFMEFRKNGTSIDPAPWIGPALASQSQ